MEIKLFQFAKSFISLDDIKSELKDGKFYHEINAAQDPLHFFVKVTVSLLNDVKVIIGREDIPVKSKIVACKIEDKAEFIERLKNSASKVGIYTSGTTGEPKLYFHSIRNLANSVKYSGRDLVWASAYSFNHIAFLKVYLQAVLNGHLMLSLFGLSMSEINRLINEEYISNISGTPTFYRLLDDSFIFNKVLSVTMGGERFTPADLEKVERIFPNAKIRNIYASTEAGTLLTTDGEFFKIDDNDLSKICIKDGIIYVNRSYVSEDLNFEGEWYNTGDAVEFDKSKGKYRILGRKSEIINIGGENVSLIEVESKIITLEYVKDVVVKAIKNSVIGNILKAEIVLQSVNSHINEEKIHLDLKEKLPGFMIPRIFVFVDAIDYTNTLKKKR